MTGSGGSAGGTGEGERECQGCNENPLDYPTDPGGDVYLHFPGTHPTQTLDIVGEGREESNLYSRRRSPGGEVSVSIRGQKRG